MGRAVQKATAAPASARKLRLEKVTTIFLSIVLEIYELSSYIESKASWPPRAETASR
jgi:hypothetical protein